MPTDKKETNTAKGTAKTTRSITAAANRSQNPPGRAVFEALPLGDIGSHGFMRARISLLNLQLKLPALLRPRLFRKNVLRRFWRDPPGISAMAIHQPLQAITLAAYVATYTVPSGASVGEDCAPVPMITEV